jgi:ABC-type polar amino acid transport system ATPase subunit
MSIQITGLAKEYRKKEDPRPKRVLDIKDISLPWNDITVIWGNNGSGKSTLLHCLGGLLAFETGKIEVNVEADAPASAITYTLQSGKNSGPPRDLRKKIGYIFQQKLLWNHLSVIDNITHPLIWVRGRPRKEAFERALHHLGLLGVADLRGSYPNQLSGGQQRKVAIARTLAMEPDFLLIDELEANLDQASVKEVMKIIKKDFIDTKKTILIVSHSPDLLEEFNPNVLDLHDGRVVTCARGVEELLRQSYGAKERAKLLKDSVDSSTSRWFLANQSLEAAIRLSEINLAEKDINTLFVKMGEELSKLISQFEPDAEHLLLIATPINDGDTQSTAEVTIRCAEQSERFVLDGAEADKLEPVVKRSFQDGKYHYELVEDHRSFFRTRGGIDLKRKPGSQRSSLMGYMIERPDELKYQCTNRHTKIKGAYDIKIPIEADRLGEKESYYEFSTKTQIVYLIGCRINNEVKGVISIDTTSDQKLSNFLMQQLILIGNMVAIAIKNHEESTQ